MRHQAALRIDTGFRAFEFQPRNAELHDRHFHLRRQLAVNVNEGRIRRQLGFQIGDIQFREDARKAAGGLNGVEQAIRPCGQCRGRQAGRHDDAVAVDDGRAIGRHRRFGNGMGRFGLRRGGGEGPQIDQSHADGGKGKGHHRAGDQQAGASGLDRPAEGAVGARRNMGQDGASAVMRHAPSRGKLRRFRTPCLSERSDHCDVLIKVAGTASAGALGVVAGVSTEAGSPSFSGRRNGIS